MFIDFFHNSLTVLVAQRRTWNFIRIFCAFISFSYILLKIYTINAATTSLLFVILWFFFAVSRASSLSKHCRIDNYNAFSDIKYEKRTICKIFLFSFVLIMIFWTIIWLAYYPGIFSYDPKQDTSFTVVYGSGNGLGYLITFSASGDYIPSTKLPRLRFMLGLVITVAVAPCQNKRYNYPIIVCCVDELFADLKE